MKKIKKVIIHSSDSPWGTAITIDDWHRKRGWKCIGYSAVITNGIPTNEMFVEKKRWHWADGQIEWGRPFDDDTFIEDSEIGAHAYGWNSDSVGICLIGKDGVFTTKQILVLEMLCQQLKKTWPHLSKQDFIGHHEIDPHKTCPDINMKDLREFIFGVLPYEKIRFGPHHIRD